MFEPRLPFEEDIEHVKADTTEEVCLKADTTEQVRLKADSTEMDEAVGVRRPHEKSIGAVRLQADDINIGSVRLSPSREATADRNSLGGGGQPDGGHQPDLADADARRAAVDPSQNIVLEASAGTGKTRVLVERYVNLLRAGVEPDHILAITFTRKAAAEMRQRIVDRLKEASRTSELDAARWRELRERLGDIAISTIDAFCLSLLREFPLEADVDPGFDLAAETDVPRLVSDSLDQALRICRAVASGDDDVALVFAQLGERRLRAGIGALLDRRLVAPQALRRFLESGPRDLTAQRACESAAARLRDIFLGARDGLDRFLDDGPVRHPQFAMLADDIRHLVETGPRRSGSAEDHRGAEQAPPLRTRESQAAFRTLVDRVRAYFLTQDGRPRGGKFTGTGFTGEHCGHEDAWRRHRATAAGLAPAVAEAVRAFRRDLNVVLSRGVWRIFAVALSQYQRTLETHALVDFSGVLERSLKLLRDLDEFAETRLRLEARYRHVLLDEFQDTSRAQWELVRQLVKSWGEGFGAADDALPPSIFIVGDRKQSIYGFRDADVALVDEAARFIETLRPGGRPRRAIAVSFRSAPAILAFINDLFTTIGSDANGQLRKDAFRYAEQDRFPIDDVRLPPSREAAADRRSLGGGGKPDQFLGLIAADTVRSTADLVANEVTRLLGGATVRDRTTGVVRAAQPADVAILFRSRDSHREFEDALDRAGIPTYVYKGLGFFEADEIQDAVAVLRYLADPLSTLRAATLLRSRVVRLSDGAIARLAPDLAQAILAPEPPAALDTLETEDRSILDLLRHCVPRWLSWVDRTTPSELLDAVLRETAYAGELRGSRRRQARENLKKLRSMIRRAQNRGYATLARIAEHLDRLALGDESNAAIDAIDAVSLMTVHAAKGLEFPIVFVVNMGRGTGGIRPPIRVGSDPAGEPSVAVGDYQSEADEDATARDREESKRLLYVALTRARDRLYLSATVQDGTCRTTRGSLGEILPASVKALFASAGAVPHLDEVRWIGPSGDPHTFVVPDGVAPPRATRLFAGATPVIDDFGPLT
jgi:ATP-dependent helicase/nuclease subunit A